MEKFLSKIINDINKRYTIEALYIYGSYVNGYYRADSDIDIVSISSQDAKRKPVNIKPNISLHIIHPTLTDDYNYTIPYSHLRMVPVINKKKCEEISDKMKLELVRRQLIRFKDRGKTDFNVLDPIINYLYSYSSLRPWRVKPIKRTLASKDSLNILMNAYRKVFDLLEEKRVIMRNGGRYKINPDHVFDKGFDKQKDGFLYKVRESYLGYYYLRTFPDIIKFNKIRI